MKLDLRKFKHVSSDGKTTKLKHEDGHFLVVAHKPLSKDYKAQLEALSKASVKEEAPQPQMMAEGGQPIFGSQPERDKMDERDRQKYGQQPSDQTSPPGAEEEFKRRQLEQEAKNKAEGYAQGGEVCHACGGAVHKYAEGGDVASQVVPNYSNPEDIAAKTVPPSETVPPELQRTREIYNQLTSHYNPKGMTPDKMQSTFGPQGQEPQNFNPDNWARAEQLSTEEKAANADKAAAEQQRIAQVNQARTSAGLQPIPQPDIPNGPQIPGSEIAPAQDVVTGKPEAAPQVQPNDLASGMQDAYGMMKQGYGQKLAGINEMAKAQQAQGLQEAAVLQKAQQAQTDAKAAYQQHYDELNNERLAHIADIQNGYIDPNQYWTGDKNGNGGHSKIATAIGMIVAGFNPTSRPNAAIEMLNHQMEQNLQAQKENLGAKQNLLTANLRQFGNLKDASDMTRLMQADMVSNQLLQAAATAKTPMAAAAAKNAAGQLQMEMAPKFQEFAMRRSLMGLANGQGSPQSVEHMLGYMRVVNPEMAKEMEGRYVPGIGLGAVPVPPPIREQIVSHQKLQQVGQDVLNYSKTHTNVIPGTPEYNTGVQKSMILQQVIREGLLGTVFRESEKPLLQKFVDDNPAGAFKTLSSQPKIRTILESNANQLNLLKKNYGLPTQQAQPTQSEPQYKTVNGVKYKRGPNGEAVKVP